VSLTAPTKVSRGSPYPKQVARVSSVDLGVEPQCSNLAPRAPLRRFRRALEVGSQPARPVGRSMKPKHPGRVGVADVGGCELPGIRTGRLDRDVFCRLMSRPLRQPRRRKRRRAELAPGAVVPPIRMLAGPPEREVVTSPDAWHVVVVDVKLLPMVEGGFVLVKRSRPMRPPSAERLGLLDERECSSEGTASAAYRPPGV